MLAQVFEYLVRLTDVVVLEALNAGGKLSAVVETLIAAVRDILTHVLSEQQVRFAAHAPVGEALAMRRSAGWAGLAWAA